MVLAELLGAFCAASFAVAAIPRRCRCGVVAPRAAPDRLRGGEL